MWEYVIPGLWNKNRYILGCTAHRKNSNKCEYTLNGFFVLNKLRQQNSLLSLTISTYLTQLTLTPLSASSVKSWKNKLTDVVSTIVKNWAKFTLRYCCSWLVLLSPPPHPLSLVIPPPPSPHSHSSSPCYTPSSHHKAHNKGTCYTHHIPYQACNRSINLHVILCA